MTGTLNRPSSRETTPEKTPITPQSPGSARRPFQAVAIAGLIVLTMALVAQVLAPTASDNPVADGSSEVAEYRRMIALAPGTEIDDGSFDRVEAQRFERSSTPARTRDQSSLVAEYRRMRALAPETQVDDGSFDRAEAQRFERIRTEPSR